MEIYRTILESIEIYRNIQKYIYIYVYMHDIEAIQIWIYTENVAGPQYGISGSAGALVRRWAVGDLVFLHEGRASPALPRSFV